MLLLRSVADGFGGRLVGGFQRTPVIECKSRIDGKLIRVRHAEEKDALSIRDMAKSCGLEDPGMVYSGYVVAEEEGRLLGFAFTESVRGRNTGFRVYIDEKQSYLADTMVKHLAENPRR